MQQQVKADSYLKPLLGEKKFACLPTSLRTGSLLKFAVTEAVFWPIKMILSALALVLSDTLVKVKFVAERTLLVRVEHQIPGAPEVAVVVGVVPELLVVKVNGQTAVQKAQSNQHLRKLKNHFQRIITGSRHFLPSLFDRQEVCALRAFTSLKPLAALDVIIGRGSIASGERSLALANCRSLEFYHQLLKTPDFRALTNKTELNFMQAHAREPP